MRKSLVSMAERSRAYVYDCRGATKTSPGLNPLKTYVKESMIMHWVFGCACYCLPGLPFNVGLLMLRLLPCTLLQPGFFIQTI